MKHLVLILFAIALVVVGVVLSGKPFLASGASKPEAEASVRKSPGGRALPSKSSRQAGPEESPQSPAVRALLAELDQSLTEFLEMKSGDAESLRETDMVHWRIRRLLKDYREAGERGSDLLDLASKLVAHWQDEAKWLLNHFVLEAAKINARAVAAWWDTDAPDYLVESKWNFRLVAQEWIQTEPREAIRWVEDNFDRLDSTELAYIL